MGLSKLCPIENVPKINRHILLTYLKNHYVPERIVVGGVGVDHQQLVESVQKYAKYTRIIFICYINRFVTYFLNLGILLKNNQFGIMKN